MLKKIYTAEFNDNGTSRAAENITKMFIEYRQFLDLMERECSKEGNHYKLPLPIRNLDAVFPNNRRMAELRLTNLKKRFIKDKQCHKDYTGFMEDIIKKGYAEMSDPKTNQQGKSRVKVGSFLIMAGFPIVGGMGGHPPILQFFLNPPPPTKTNSPPWGAPPLKNEAPHLKTTPPPPSET